jgi:hypothetical protein
MATSGTCGKRYGGEIQLFPQAGRLVHTLNLDLTTLRKVVPAETRDVYCYIVKTIECKDRHFIQTGTAPNFQGGIITLCTCKHQMRSRHGVNAWPGQWIAGFTSRAGSFGRHHLVYLMRVAEAYASHQELWNAVPDKVRQAKAAHLHRGGDMYEPQSSLNDPFDQRSYVAPCEDHDHTQINEETNAPYWYQDINYVGRDGGRPPLLVGDTELSFLWEEPALRLPYKLPRDYAHSVSLRDLVGQLEPIDSR